MDNKIRILFIGELHSSHALNWINLIADREEEFEIQGLHISVMAPPETLFKITDSKNLEYFCEDQDHTQIKNILLNETYVHGLGTIQALQLFNAVQLVREFKPHIIHTLGVFPASIFYLRALEFLDKKIDWWNPFWIVQARGGPDIALNHRNPALKHEIQLILGQCDYFIADNQQNYFLALNLGLASEKISMTGPVPGAGGVDPILFDGVPLPSQKERLILWPKAYNCIQSDGLVVVEALRLALPNIGKFRLVATAATPDIEYWLRNFLAPYGAQIEICDRLPHAALLKLYRSARVLLAPSLSDGIPNSMYEAMASHTVPILSPIETLEPLFEDRVHTIYARNLDPFAIAKALTTAMNDDNLADAIALTNREWLPSLAGRDIVRDRVISMYRHVVELHPLKLALDLVETRTALEEMQLELFNVSSQLERLSSNPILKISRNLRRLYNLPSFFSKIL